MMEIEIKFGKGRSDRVQVHYGDDAGELAKVSLLRFAYQQACLTITNFWLVNQEFVLRHKLKESSIPVITKYIETTMETYLSQPRLPRRPKETSGF
jgi:hypothetical protein